MHSLCNCIYDEDVMQFMNDGYEQGKRLNDHLQLCVCAEADKLQETAGS
jgi:hypothetical protein